MSAPDDFGVERAGLVVAVRGDLDYAHHERLDAVLTAMVPDLDHGDELVVDLAGVVYCDSCGLRVLLGASQQAEAHGARLVLRGASGQPARALRLTGLDTVLAPGSDHGSDRASDHGAGAQA